MSSAGRTYKVTLFGLVMDKSCDLLFYLISYFIFIFLSNSYFFGVGPFAVRLRNMNFILNYAVGFWLNEKLSLFLFTCYFSIYLEMYLHSYLRLLSTFFKSTKVSWNSMSIFYIWIIFNLIILLKMSIY